MSVDAGDRVGARPLSAFHTADIVVPGEHVHEEEEESSTIGITPLTTAIAIHTSPTDEEEEEEDENDTDPPSDSILMSPSPVFGLLQDPHADPPISPDTRFATHTQHEEEDDLSSEEYHSAPEEEEHAQKRHPMFTASPFDYDVNWDMVGHLRRRQDKQEEKEEHEQLNTSTTSLAEAAAASMIATTVEEPQILRRTVSSRYRYAKEEDHSEGDAEEDFIVAETASEMNESTTSTSSSSTHRRRRNESTTSTSSSSTHRRRRQRPFRTSSAPLTRTRQRRLSSSSRIIEEDTSSGLRASLDSGMASVRRWIRSQSMSRAARSWQRESSQLQLGEEDLFALTNAGDDPRGVYDDNTYRFPSSPGVRQRALSEPNNVGLRNFFFQRAAGRDETSTSSANSLPLVPRMDTSSTRSMPTQLSSAALNSSLFHSSPTEQIAEDMSSLAEETSVPPATSAPPTTTVDDDPNREARTRWIRINRRFQLIITVVALIFSLLLFAILVCWVVFTSAYVVSIEKVRKKLFDVACIELSPILCLSLLNTHTLFFLLRNAMFR